MATVHHSARPVSPELPNDPPPSFFAQLDLARTADLCAWLADCPDNHLEDYPGPGWSNPANWPLWTNQVRYGLGPGPAPDPLDAEPDDRHWEDRFEESRSYPDDWDCLPGRIG